MSGIPSAEAPTAGVSDADMSTTPATTLVDTLRGFADDDLAELLRARPDLITPLPSDVDQLAARAATRTSVVRILDKLDRLALAVVEGLVVSPPPVSFADLLDLLDVPETGLEQALTALRGLGLVWGPDEALDLPTVASEVLGPHPAGLGPPARIPLTADDVAARLAETGAEGRTVAERLSAGRPFGQVTSANRELTVETARSPVERLLARGLLVALDARTVALPREVGLYLRGGKLHPAGELEPPALSGTLRDPALVDRTAAGATLEFVRRVEQLLDDWGGTAPAVLRSGGLGVRDLRRAATVLDVDERTAALTIECTFAAGLVGAEEDGAWLPTPAYDDWLADSPARRWVRLADAWLRSLRVPGLVGSRDERDRPRAALSAEVDRPSAPELRQLVVDVLAAAEPGRSVEGARLLERIRWERPRRWNRFLNDFAGWTLDEASVLGVTGLGALAGHGRALARGADPDSVAGVLEPTLPEPVDQVLLQADLTAVAPGPLRPELARALAAMADAESHGGATVYRFTPSSVRRALDAGRTAAELHDLLATRSATPVPQPLTYLVDDVARRHGHLRAGTASAYLRCDDPAALDALAADRRTAGLGLRRLAPTVLVSPQPRRALLDELRELGYAPVPENADGALVLDSPPVRRTAEQRPRRPTISGLREPEPEILVAAVRALRAGDRARAHRPVGATVGRLRRSASVEAVGVLRAALEGGWSVWMGYVDQHGGASDRIVDPVRIDGGLLTAYDHAAGTARTFALHRITGAAPARSDQVR